MKTWFELEEVAVLLGPLLDLMNLAFFHLLMRGPRKLGTLGKIEPDVESAFFLGELEVDDFPGV